MAYFVIPLFHVLLPPLLFVPFIQLHWKLLSHQSTHYEWYSIFIKTLQHTFWYTLSELIIIWRYVLLLPFFRLITLLLWEISNLPYSLLIVCNVWNRHITRAACSNCSLSHFIWLCLSVITHWMSKENFHCTP